LRIKVSKASGTTILLVGIALLSVTFIIACIHLFGGINVLPVPSLTASLGKGLSPLVEAVFRILYLGLMGLIASKVTEKGLTALLQAKLLDKTTSQKSNRVISE